GEHVCKRVARGFDRERLSRPRWNRHVEICRVGCDTLDRASLSPEMSAHEPHVRSIVIGNDRDVCGLDLLIAGRRHLERVWKICPQLKAVHSTRLIAFRHFLMDDAAARRHPLDIAGAYSAAVTQTIAVFDRPGEHVSDRLDAAVGMPGEAGEV